MAKDKDYTALPLEDISTKVQGVAEAVSSLNEKVDRIDHRLAVVEKHTEHIPAIEVAIKDQSRQLNDYEVRLSQLEAAA